MGVRSRGTAGRRLRPMLIACGLLLTAVPRADAQVRSGGNQGALAVSANLEVPSVYVFRGLVQEPEPAVTVQPSASVAADLGPLIVTVATWHSLQTGSSGLDGPTGRLHYEERFSGGVVVPARGGASVGVTYTAYSSPNNLFDTRQEVAVRVDVARPFHPYGLVALELRGAADGTDEGTGTYLELGAAPGLSPGTGRVTLSVPVRVGLSLKDYYQGFRGDSRFGFFSLGGQVSFPLAAGGAFGAWHLRGGVEYYLFGDTPQAFSNGDRHKVVAVIGASLKY